MAGLGPATHGFPLHRTPHAVVGRTKSGHDTGACATAIGHWFGRLVLHQQDADNYVDTST
jgi:hypothetical protein